MKELKTNLIDLFTQKIAPVFSELESTQTKLVDATASLEQAKSNFATFLEEQNRISTKNNDTTTILQRRSSELDVREADLFRKVNDFDGKVILINKEISDKKVSRDKIIEEIQALISEKGNQELVLQSKRALESELASINTTIADKRKELDAVQSEITSAVTDIAKEIEQKQKDLKVINQDIEDRKAVVIPTLSELAVREKNINEKEMSLKIIEERYKKLYGDKGLGFKV